MTGNGFALGGTRGLVVAGVLASLFMLLLPAVAAAGERGFVAAFAPRPAADGRLPLQSLAATAGAPGPRTRELDPARDWQVRWLDADGRRIADQRIPDPLRPLLGSVDPRQPLLVRFADIPAAVLAEVRDAHGALRGEVPLDATSRARADAALRASDRRLAAARGRVGKRAAEPSASAADATRRLLFQVAVQQRVDDRREQRCGPGRRGWRIPERVSADPCRAPVAAATATAPPPPFAPVALLPVALDHGLRGPLREPVAPKADTVTLTGKLLFPEGSTPPTGPVTLYSWGAPGGNSGYVLQASPPEFAFSSPVVVGADVDLEVVSPSPFLPVTVPLGVITANTYREVLLERGVAVTGRVRFPAGTTPPAAGFPVQFSDDHGFGTSVTAMPPEFAFARAFAPGSTVRVVAQPPSPFLARDARLGTVDADTSIDLVVARGVVVRGHVTGPASYSVFVRDLASGDWPWQQAFSAPDFEVAVAPTGATVEVDASGWFPEAFAPVGGADAEVEFALAPRPGSANVTLTLRDGTGQPLPQARAEAWRDGALVRSGVSDGAGVATLELADGAYEIRVWPDTEAANAWSWETTKLFADPALVAPLAVAGPTAATLQVAAADWLAMRVPLPVEAPLPGCTSTQPYGRLELLRDGRVVARGNFRGLYGYSGGPHRLITGRGMFVLRYLLPGGVRWQSEPFRAANGTTIPLYRVGTAPQHVWTGTLRNPAGAPVGNRDIRISDELGITLSPVCAVRTAADGRFRVPLCEGCVVSFEASAVQSAQRRTVVVDGPVAGSREEDVALGRPLAFAPLAPSGTSRVFGRADAPFRLVFLAEGYAAERETYTDVNGNGLWDGIQWVDVDGDGLWQQDEPTAQYGVAPWPTAGSDPRTTNEPFADLNGDGVLSLDDRALFERNVQDYLRGLFSADQFAAYRGAYQASASMAYSPQVGMDHGASARDTLFGARFEPDRGLISIDYGAAQQAAAAAEPGYTVVVVMINQPVPYGRVNSFVLASGGVLGGDVNDNVAGHEFGHNPGGLADEYSEFAGAWIGADPGSPNSTRFVDRELVPWGGRVAPELDGRPTKPWLAREGFFEGSSYYGAGAFRPAQASMMRYMDSLLFNGASRDQLRRVHARALRGSGRLTIDGTQRDCLQFAVSWDASALGTTAVELRGDAFDGPVLGRGAGAGSAWLKPLAKEAWLVDANSGIVLDIAPVPVLRCARK